MAVQLKTLLQLPIIVAETFLLHSWECHHGSCVREEVCPSGLEKRLQKPLLGEMEILSSKNHTLPELPVNGMNLKPITRNFSLFSFAVPMMMMMIWPKLCDSFTLN